MPVPPLFRVLDSGGDLAMRKLRANVASGLHLRSIFHQIAAGVEDEGVAAFENVRRRKRLELGGEMVQACTAFGQAVTDRHRHGRAVGVELLVEVVEAKTEVEVTKARGSDVETTH